MNKRVMMPNVIKESSSGYQAIEIIDELFRDREIACVGEITAELVSSLILQLRYLQKEDSEKEITLYINSPGGEVSSGLALYDVMKAISCPVRTVCLGMAASMAAVLFLSGDERSILPHAKVMIHDPLISEMPGGSALKLDQISRNLMKTREIVGKIIAEHTGKTLEEVYEKTSKDSYFDAEESLAWGLADRIITEM
ncbi:MAG: ATP-dependent Clp protease proteolytic subunit [Lachnospiraceae bacterium]|nr:ATP-dependent Clp protease proteolytic subunit [Lachnospiraceae bacterium]